MFIRHRLFCFLVLRQARMLFRPTDRALGKPAELVMRVERLRGVRTDAAARLRLRVLDATVGRRCVRVSLRLFRCNGLCALAALRCRCADARVIRRCRAVAAAGECGGSQGCGSGDQQCGDKILVHDVAPICMSFKGRSGLVFLLTASMKCSVYPYYQFIVSIGCN